jgi:FkbM family methyltransferase
MDFSSVSRDTVIGRLLRTPLMLVPKRARIPVLQGPLRGAKWIAAAHTHGCWLGSYEADKQRLFASLVQVGDVVYDVGANAGYYTLLASRLCGAAGRVIAMEPLPRNLDFLQQHLRLNRSSNVTVLDVALAEAPGSARFRASVGSAEGSLAADGDIEVRVTTIDAIVQDCIAPPPRLIKMDIEGGELAALRGAREVLRKHRPVLLLATHGPEIHGACLKLLHELGYAVTALTGPNVELCDELLARPLNDATVA